MNRPFSLPRMTVFMSMAASITSVSYVPHINFTAGAPGRGPARYHEVARNFFLQRKNADAKFNEMLLAFKIEHTLSKDEILQLYINQITLVNEAYGFASADRYTLEVA